MCNTYNVLGFVRDNTNRPISEAAVHVTETNQTTTTDHQGRYNVTLSPGKYTVKVNVDGYESSVKYVDVSGLILVPKFVIFTLVKDASVMGLPRLVFVIFSGKSTTVLSRRGVSG